MVDRRSDGGSMFRPEDLLDSPTVAPSSAPVFEGRYRLDRLIARGGMGEVFEGEDLALRRRVAIKVVTEDASRDPELCARFRWEAELLAKFDHPHIVPVYSVGEHQGRPYLVMKMLRGCTLEQLIRESGPLPLRAVVHLGAQILAGLAEIHRCGCLHRDIKPANLMIDAGKCTILDFGIGSAGRSIADTAVKLGTPAYAAPEQWSDARLAGPRSDLYSLGATFYAALVGRPWSGAATTLAELPASAVGFMTRALARSPPDRFQTAEEMALALLALAEPRWITEPAETRPFVEAPTSAITDRSQAGADSLRRRRHRWPALVLFGAIVGAGVVAGLALARIGLIGGKDRALHSIAVLPFRDLSSEPEQEFLADGLTEELITDLAQVRSLRVVSRTTMMRYKAANKPLPDIARELNVEGLVEGSVARSKDRVRIRAQLIDGRTDEHLWAQSFDRGVESLLDIQADVARSIVRQIHATLPADDDARLSKALAHKAGSEAYQLYWKGRHACDKMTEQTSKKAIEYFERAIDLDPDFARAYVGLSDAYYLMSNLYLPPKEAMPKARAAAERALQFDDTLAEAHASLGRVKELYDWDPEGAEQSFRRALELDPDAAAVHQMYGLYLSYFGRTDESRAHLARALELEPLSERFALSTFWPDHCERRPDLAMRPVEALLKSSPSYTQAYHALAVLKLEAGNLDEALHYAVEGLKIEESVTSLVILGLVQAKSGRRAEALEILRSIEQSTSGKYVSPVPIADLHLALGDKEAALQVLESAYRDRSEELVYLRCNPELDPLRGDARFDDLLRRVHLPE